MAFSTSSACDAGVFSDDRAGRRAGIEQGNELGIVGRRQVFPAGAAERAEFRITEFEAGRFPEEVEIARIGSGPAALDVGHAEFIQFHGDAQLVVLGERDVFSLGAVA